MFSLSQQAMNICMLEVAKEVLTKAASCIPDTVYRSAFGKQIIDYSKNVAFSFLQH